MRLRVAQNPGDYKLARDLLRAEDKVPEQPLKFPTIIAFNDDDKVVGVIATTIQEGMIIAGPLAVDSSQRRIFTALKLMQAYDNAMMKVGIFTYILPVEYGSLVAAVIDRYYPHVSPYAETDDVCFYTRRLDGSQEASNGRA